MDLVIEFHEDNRGDFFYIRNAGYSTSKYWDDDREAFSSSGTKYRCINEALSCMKLLIEWLS
jgi:hypothetical protein